MLNDQVSARSKNQWFYTEKFNVRQQQTKATPTKTEKKNVVSLYVTYDSGPSGDYTGR